jgi:ATP-dependent DNA helicase RecG
VAARRDDRFATAPRVTLDMPVQFLKGVGERRAALLRKLGIETALDLLYHVPHRYEDASTITAIAAVAPGMDVTVMGRVVSKGIIPTRKGLRIFQAVVKDERWTSRGRVSLLDRTINKEDVLLLSARAYHGGSCTEFVNLGAEDSGSAQGRVLSVYPATDGITAKQLRALIELHLNALLALVQEHLPPSVQQAAGVAGLVDALRKVHRPSSVTEANEGRDRLAFDELLFVQLLHRRANALAREPRRGIVFTNRRTLTSQLRTTLPFALTGAQVRALKEIAADMCSPRRMHRLLQGDVGSGKRWSRSSPRALAVENGFQAALMAPPSCWQSNTR